MSSSTNPETSERERTCRVYIRRDDYYGGDVYLEASGESWDEEASITWEAWGNYGTATIRLSRAVEMQRLGEALLAVAQLADPEGYRHEQ